MKNQRNNISDGQMQTNISHRWPKMATVMTKCGDRCAIRSPYASSSSRKDNNRNANPTSVFGVKKTTSAARSSRATSTPCLDRQSSRGVAATMTPKHFLSMVAM
jgi:hypothetical protein